MAAAKKKGEKPKQAKHGGSYGPQQRVARKELSRVAHQLGAHSLCNRTSHWSGSLIVLLGKLFFFGVVNDYIPSFTGLAPQVLEDNRVEASPDR